jgi:hypothetical protein
MPDKLNIGLMSNGTLALTGQERAGVLNVDETTELLNYIKDLATVVDEFRGEGPAEPDDFDDMEDDD